MPQTKTNDLQESRGPDQRFSWRPYAIAAIIIFSASSFFTHVFLPMASKGMAYHDFYPIIAASQVLREGKNPYERGVVGDQIQTFRPGHPVASGYLYPTFWAHVVTPLALLSPQAAQRIWHGFNLIFVVLIFTAGIYLLVPPDKRLYAWAFVLGAFSFFQPIHETMHVGQVNLFITLMIAWGVYFAARKYFILAGIFLAVGAMVKLWPLVVLYYFLLHRKWKLLAASFVTACVIVAGSFMLTPNAIQADYFTVRLPQTVFEGNTKPISSIHNVSLRGFVHRAFTSEAADVLAAGGTMKFPPRHVIGLNPDSISIPFLILTIFSLAAVSWIVFLRRHEKQVVDPTRLMVNVSVFILFLAIFSTFFTEHYLVLLILPFMTLFLSPRLHSIFQEKKYLIILSAVSFFLTGFLHHNYQDYYRLWEGTRIGAFLLQPQTYGLLLLFGILIYLSFRLRQEDAVSNADKV